MRMRLAFIALILLFTSRLSQAVASQAAPHPVSADPWQANRDQAVLRKRQTLEAASRWSKQEVPPYLKGWKLFQDGNPVREKIRSGYMSMLRQIDKVREPYPEYGDFRKKWMYLPDLRKHYFLPRVLRVPVIVQESAIPHLESFAGAVKDTDKELGLNTLAKSHVPALSEHFDESARTTQMLPGSKTNIPIDAHISPRTRAARSNRRKARIEKIQSFSEFRRPRAPPGEDSKSAQHQPTSGTVEDNLGISAPSGQADTVGNSFNPIEGVKEGPKTPNVPENNDNKPLLDSPKEGADADAEPGKIATENFGTYLMDMSYQFGELKNFQKAQIGKAAARYIGHADNPAVTNGNELEAAARQGGAPVQDVPVEMSPQLQVFPSPEYIHSRFPARKDELGDMDAGVPAPNMRVTPQHSPESSSPNSGLNSSPMILSRPQTPPSTLGTGSQTPPYSYLLNTPPVRGSPGLGRLPSNYADLIMAARRQQGMTGVTDSSSHPRMAVANPPSSHLASADLLSMWDRGPISREGLESLHNVAEMNDAGYAIYDTSPESEGGTPTRSRKLISLSRTPSDLSVERSDPFYSLDSSTTIAKTTPEERAGTTSSGKADSPPDSSDSPQSSGDNFPPPPSARDLVRKTRKRPVSPLGTTPKWRQAGSFFSFSQPLSFDQPTPRLERFRPALKLGQAGSSSGPSDPFQPNQGTRLTLHREKLMQSISGTSFRKASSPSSKAKGASHSNDESFSVVEAFRKQRQAMRRLSGAPFTEQSQEGQRQQGSTPSEALPAQLVGA